jgi:hypothetical protein
VLEGHAAFIASGSSVPVVTQVAAGAGRRPWVAGVIERRALNSGFLVTPRLTADGRVALEVQQQREAPEGGEIDAQALATALYGPMGVWLELGGVGTTGVSEQRGTLRRQYSTRSVERSIWIKVDPAGEPP